MGFAGIVGGCGVSVVHGHQCSAALQVGPSSICHGVVQRRQKAGSAGVQLLPPSLGRGRQKSTSQPCPCMPAGKGSRSTSSKGTVQSHAGKG